MNLSNHEIQLKKQLLTKIKHINLYILNYEVRIRNLQTMKMCNSFQSRRKAPGEQAVSGKKFQLSVRADFLHNTILKEKGFKTG